MESCRAQTLHSFIPYYRTKHTRGRRSVSLTPIVALHNFSFCLSSRMMMTTRRVPSRLELPASFAFISTSLLTLSTLHCERGCCTAIQRHCKSSLPLKCARTIPWPEKNEASEETERRRKKSSDMNSLGEELFSLISLLLPLLRLCFYHTKWQTLVVDFTCHAYLVWRMLKPHTFWKGSMYMDGSKTGTI